MTDRSVRRCAGMVDQCVVAVAVMVAVLVGGCSFFPSFPTEDAPAKIASPADGYLLEPGNQVHLTVFYQENLSGTFSLDAAGNIALPLLERRF